MIKEIIESLVPTVISLFSEKLYDKQSNFREKVRNYRTDDLKELKNDFHETPQYRNTIQKLEEGGSNAILLTGMSGIGR